MRPLFGLSTYRVFLAAAAIASFTPRPLLATAGLPSGPDSGSCKNSPLMMPEGLTSFLLRSGSTLIYREFVCISLGIRSRKQPGKPDFTAIDKTVAVFRRIGMSVSSV